MTREQKIAKARELRTAGKRNPEVALALGVPLGTAVLWLKGVPYPPRTCYVCNSEFVPKHGSQKVCCGENARKRFHENAERRECEQCGQQLAAGSRYPNRAHWRLCGECKRDNSYHRTVHFIELREQGLMNKEIEELEDLPFNTVATMLNRAGRYGLEVPPPPYWSRGKVAA